MFQLLLLLTHLLLELFDLFFMPLHLLYFHSLLLDGHLQLVLVAVDLYFFSEFLLVLVFVVLYEFVVVSVLLLEFTYFFL